MVDHIDEYRKQVDELTFENHTLRKDLRELTGTLKDYQEKEFRAQQASKAKVEAANQQEERVILAQRQVEAIRKEMQAMDKKQEDVRCAFNADK